MGPKFLLRQWAAAPRFYQLLAIFGVYYWLAFWTELFTAASIDPPLMATSVVGFWAVIAIAYLTVPIFSVSAKGPLSVRIPFTAVAFDVPTQRPILHTALFTAPVAIFEVIILARVAEGANVVCTILTLVALAALARNANSAAIANHDYSLGAVVFVRMNDEQFDGSYVRPAIVGGHVGSWVVLIPISSQDQSLNREYVRFDRGDWPELNEPQAYVHLTSVQLTKPEQITFEAGEITERAGRKLTEAAERIPAQLRRQISEERHNVVPRFDFDENDIEVPIAFGDESAMRALDNIYNKRGHSPTRVFVGAFALTAISFALHKTGAVKYLLDRLDHFGPGEMVQGVASASWTVGAVWSLFVAVLAWAAVTWSAQITAWMRDEIVGDAELRDVSVRDTFDRYWQRVGKRVRRALAAVGIGTLMAFTTAPSLTGCAIFFAFGFVSYIALAPKRA